MSRLLLAIALAVTAVLPAAPRADDWDYDVSVDLNVQGGGVGIESFQGPLSPYGDWVVVGNYGQVWRPRVAAGWRPYYYGRWEWTNEGWFWVSDEPWGWAAYHYGRWAYDPYYGWLWVPGSEWAPAWVSWRVSGDAVGWAPLAPGFSAYVTTYPFIDFWWTFVPSGRFCSHPVYSVAYAPTYARRWYEATAPAPAYVPRGGPGLTGRGGGAAPAWGGPAPRLIEARAGRPLAPARIVRAPSPGERGRPGEIAIYRPERIGRDDRRGPPAAAPGLVGRDDRRGPPATAPGLVGRGAERGGGFRPDGRAPDARPPEFRGPERRGAPELRGPEAGHGGAPVAPRGGFVERGGAPGGFGRGGSPGVIGRGNDGGRGGFAPAPSGDHGGGRGGWAPPQGGGGNPGGGGNAGGGARGGGGGHGRGERR